MKYYFPCCKCKQKSDYLGKDDYMRLQLDQDWICEKCIGDNHEKVKEYLNGFIIKKVEEF